MPRRRARLLSDAANATRAVISARFGNCPFGITCRASLADLAI